MNEEIKKALEDKFKGTMDKIEDLQKNGATKDEMKKLTEALKTQGQALKDIEETIKEQKIESFGEKFRGWLIANKDRLEEIRTSGTGTMEFKLDPVDKAVGNMTTGSGGDAVTAPSNQNTSLGAFNYRNDNSLLSLFSVGSTNQASFPYTELLPKEGGFSAVAEGGTKPQIDFQWEVRYSTPKKIAAYEVLTEEVAQDIDRMVAVAKQFLRERHDLYKVDRCFFGDGTGANPEGATVVGRVFSAGAMATAVTNPNFMDVVNACITDIYTTHNYTDEMPYMANIVLVDPTDFFLNLVAVKDADGHPLYPTASLFNAVQIGGAIIRPWEKIPSGKIFVGDMKKYRIENYIPYSVRIGWINDQLITNMFTMVGESRFHAYVKNLDRQAFIYDDIATVETAITAP